MAVLFLCLLKVFFISFQFPLHMNFFQGTFLHLKKKPFSMSEFSGFKNIDMSKCKNNLHKSQGLSGMSS